MSYFLIIIIALILTYSIYCVIPTIYHKFFKTYAIKNIGYSKDVALTFDDGPDEVYTSELLDLLKQANVKATFFVVAEKADENPEIIDRMIKEGHAIGLHSLQHKNSWLKGYQYTKNDFKRSIEIMKKHRWNVEYYRPPWGHVNLYTLKYLKENNLKLVLWNVMVGDWSRFNSLEKIKKEILRQTKFGSVICLHDSRGAECAPKRTIEALKTDIPILKDRGFNFVRLDQVKYGA
ncbi:polysaccharide deacetylase family protein [Abyssisolibacter fermentans]|uniref:polysaccharide deacetylase family protein n=1 Tax=Abyssisolibacter fermentans TaxID=1766203 RepID=UPI000835CDCF|nr:polysaccharide deacetylase family protein [Abyssisolibacter fermentans]